MTSIFIKELKKYTYDDLRVLLACDSDEKFKQILKKLKEYGVLKTIKKSDVDIDDLQYEDEIIVEVEESISDINYVFNYVGVIAIGGILFKCYPKYINKTSEPTNELKQILRVIEKYNSKEQIIKMYNESDYSGSFNYLAITLYLLKDYYEFGIYRNDKNVIEINGEGSVLWDKTINETFMLISNNKPYYIELKTKKNKDDNLDFFTRLHQIILTKASKEFESYDILSLFDLSGVDLTEEKLEDLGDIEYISNRIQEELNVEFYTRKQNLLKLFYTYLNRKSSIYDIDCLSLYGTQNFNMIWEKACANIFNNQLHIEPKDIDKKMKCTESNVALVDLIEKPEWTYTGNAAKDTLRPDIITLFKNNGKKLFIIFDAKYYNPLLEKGKAPKRQPGIESITKQFLYQLAYKKLITDNKYEVNNMFLLPTEDDNIQDKGSVKMQMFVREPLNLEPIKVKLIPASEVYELYLLNKKFELTKIL